VVDIGERPPLRVMGSGLTMLMASAVEEGSLDGARLGFRDPSRWDVGPNSWRANIVSNPILAASSLATSPGSPLLAPEA